MPALAAPARRRPAGWRILAGTLAALLALSAGAQDAPNGVLLVANPGIGDPRFAHTVILVTQTPDASTVGIILNRPAPLPLSELLEDEDLAESYDEPLFLGGPVLPRTLVALFESERAPGAPAFHVLRDVYLSMSPELIESLLTENDRRFRLYAGFSGWAPGQLRNEIERGDWYVLPATEALVFSEDTRTMWKDLVEKARGERACAPPRRATIPA